MSKPVSECPGCNRGIVWSNERQAWGCPVMDAPYCVRALWADIAPPPPVPVCSYGACEGECWCDGNRPDLG